MGIEHPNPLYGFRNLSLKPKKVEAGILWELGGKGSLQTHNTSVIYSIFVLKQLTNNQAAAYVDTYENLMNNIKSPALALW